MINTYSELEKTALDYSYALTCAGKTYTLFPFLGSQSLVEDAGAYFRNPLPETVTGSEAFKLYEFELMCGIKVAVIVYNP